MSAFTIPGDSRNKIEWIRCKPCAGTGQSKRTFRNTRCSKCHGDGLMPRRVVFLGGDQECERWTE